MDSQGCFVVAVLTMLLQNTHQQVKSKILERMQEWTTMFSSNPDFGIMEQAYMKLKTQSRCPTGIIAERD